MTMTKTLIWAGACLGIISLFGWSKLQSHGQTIVQEVRDEINRISPGSHEADRIRNLLDERERQLLTQHVKVDGLERKADKAVQDAAELASAISGEEDILAQAADVLSSAETHCTIGSRVYSRAEVEQDARAHLNNLENLRLQLETKNAIAIELEGAVSQQRTRIAAAEREVTRTRAELETLDLRLESARLQSLARSLSDDLLVDSLGEHDELSQSWSSYVARVEEAEVLAGVRRSQSEGAVVDWHGAMGSADILTEIAATLASGSQVASLEHPDGVGEALLPSPAPQPAVEQEPSPADVTLAQLAASAAETK